MADRNKVRHFFYLYRFPAPQITAVVAAALAAAEAKSLPEEA